MNRDRPLIIAHRGASADAPENTLAAFQLAVEQGCDGVELDIQLTKDGEIVVIHDESIDRTTNGTGKVWEMTAAEIQQFDAGSWFNKKYSDERIPLLSEVFTAIPDSIWLNIEIKNLPHPYEGIETKLLDLLTQFNRFEHVVVTSFDYRSLLKIKKQNEQVKIGLLYYQKLFDHVELAKLFGAPVYSLHPGYRCLREGDVNKIKSAGYEIFPWTVNAVKDMKKLINDNVSGLITNYPKKMKKLVSKH